MALMMAPATSTKAESIVCSSSSSSVSSYSSASGNTLSTLSKAELDRLIAENMTSVLKSLKKRKHAKKHARIRQAAEAASNAETPTMAGKGGAKAKGSEKPGEGDKKGKISVVDVVRRRISPRKHNETNPSCGDAKAKTSKHRLKELQPKTKEESSSPVPHDAGHQQAPSGESKNGKENKTINAFQLLMGARSKCIGSNSPGKDPPEVVEVAASQPNGREEKAKRKLQLQQWAERKGSGKRKLQEEAEGEYIEHQLKKRAKRFKKMIGNMSTDGVEKVQEVTMVIPDSPEHAKADVCKKRNHSPAIVATGRSPQLKALPAAFCKSEKTPFSKEEKADNNVILIQDDSNDEFLQQLSSPTKKKDSLMGYFAKVSPEGRKLKGNTSSQATPSTEPVGGKSLNATPDGADTAIEMPPSESSSRPRRSCANRIKDYAAFERFSPEKGEIQKSNQSKKPPIVTPLKIINVQSPSAMKVVKSPSMRMFLSNGDTPAGTEWPTTPKSVKLAPVFTRTNGPKSSQPQAIDPEKARARQLFLMSGIPEKMRQEMEKRTAYEEYILNESPVFPVVSHVQQLQLEAEERPCAEDLARSCIKLRPPLPESPGTARGSTKTAKGRQIRFGLFTACTLDDYEEALIKCVELPDTVESELDFELPEVANVKDIVRGYKQRYHQFPVYKCYKQFRTIYQDYQQLVRAHGETTDESSGASNIVNGLVVANKRGGTARNARGGNGLTKQPCSSSLDDSVEIIEPSYHCRNGELLFTEKYKPQHTEQILVNFLPATMLKRFLSLWQDESGSNGQRRTANGGGSMYGEFFPSVSCSASQQDDELSNGSACSSVPEVCNHVVLVGPPGCGKTCNVYAVAKEMNFNVLEINASSRRKGKIILQELLEATQSHQVRQKAERSNSLDGLLSRQAGGAGGAGGSKKKASLLNGGFSCLERRPSFCETNGNGSKKLSLILIEDADIVFEQDDGFLGAINQLVATSKRPIVLTTTNPSCPHMTRYMARNNVIRYVSPGIANVAKFLSLLALVERVPIDQHDLGRLYAHNGKDMRKTLNELQFFIQTGGDMARFATSDQEDGELQQQHTADRGETTAAELNETREEETTGMDEEGPQTLGKKAPKKGALAPGAAKHVQHHTLYQLFTRNQNEEMVLRLPLDFDTLWCNMELVLRDAKAAQAAAGRGINTNAKGDSKTKRLSTPKRQRRRAAGVHSSATSPPPDVALCDDLGFLYENISRAEAGWGVTQRSRIRYGRDVQDDQQQQLLANEMGHALVEGSWIDWFERNRTQNVPARRQKEGTDDRGVRREEKADGNGAKAYDGLRKLEQEQRQTIASYIGVNGIRSRVTACDYEPALRQICRHERNRSALERRGSRFYHYLRNWTGGILAGSSGASGLWSATSGFSVDHFDALSHRFEELEQPDGMDVLRPANETSKTH